MRRKPALFASALVFGLGICSVAGAQMAVTIDVDARAAGTPLERVWAFHGYDEPNYTTTPEGDALLRTLSAAHTAPVHVRTHFLFNTGDGTPSLKWGSTNVYTEDADGNPVYDYALLDAILDATLDAGARPLFEIGFMPQALSTRPDPYQNSGTYVLDGGCFYPPRDYDRWGELVTEWATHVKVRYPDAESSFQWELWNEPDIGYWHGTFDEYARLYDTTEAALHAVLPEASLGGPAVASPGTGFLGKFLEHCAMGTNAVTGESGTRLDMVSFHAKGGVAVANEHVQMDLGNQLRLHRAGFELVAGSSFASKPIVISEADPDGCAACPMSQWPADAYRNSPAYGAYEVAMMKRSLELAAETGVDLSGVLTWAFTFPDTPYFTGYRVLATNGIHLPVLNAFKLLGSLNGDRLAVTSSGARPLDDMLANGVRGEPDIDALAVIDGDRVQILVWNYHDDLVDAEPATVTLDVSLPETFGANAFVTHTRVDETHGDAYTAWLSQGSPATPSSSELAELRQAMEPVVIEQERAVDVANHGARLVFDLPRFGISLVTLTSESSGGAAGAGGAPSGAGGAERGATEPTGGSGCSCRLPAQAPSPRVPALLAASFLVALARRRRTPSADESPRAARASFVVLLVLAGLYVGWAARFIARTAIETTSGRFYCLFDDAMVSLRYAWNFAHGNGLVWNPGERVEGITSFLFTVTMSFGALLFDKSGAALFVQICGIPLVLGVAVMARKLGRSLDMTPAAALIPTAAVLAYYPLSYWSLMGMETGLLTLLAMAALALAMRLGSESRGSKPLGLLLGLMVLTRPDAAVPAAVILGFRATAILNRERRLAALEPWLSEVAVLAGIVAGLTLFRWVYYGALVPNSYDLKMAGWPIRFRVPNGFRFVVPFLDTSRYLLLFALVSVALRRDGRRLLLFCFSGSIIACQIWVGGDAWPYWRMLGPGVVALIVLAVDGASQLIRLVVRGEQRFVVFGFSGACAAGTLWAADRPFVDELTLEAPAYMVALNQSTVKAGLELARYADPEGSVAVAAAGAVTYYSGLRGVDVLGKSDRTIARLRGRGYDDGQTVTPGHAKFDLHYSLETLKPDAIYDAVSWSRHERGNVFGFVQANYVSRGSFWLRRDSPHIHWDRVAP